MRMNNSDKDRQILYLIQMRMNILSIYVSIYLSINSFFGGISLSLSLSLTFSYIPLFPLIFLHSSSSSVPFHIFSLPLLYSHSSNLSFFHLLLFILFIIFPSLPSLLLPNLSYLFFYSNFLSFLSIRMKIERESKDICSFFFYIQNPIPFICY